MRKPNKLGIDMVPHFSIECKPKFDSFAKLTEENWWQIWRAQKNGKYVRRRPVSTNWTSFDDVIGGSAGRKKSTQFGHGFYVCPENGLAVIFHAEPWLASQLGRDVVWCEPDIDGDGLTLIVPVNTEGSRSGVFVPFGTANNPITQSPKTAARANNPIPQNDGTEKIGESCRITQNCGTISSSSYLSIKDSSCFLDKKKWKTPIDWPSMTITTALEKLGQESIPAGKEGSADERTWVYDLISLLQAYDVKPETIDHNPNMVAGFALMVDWNVNELARLVSARWESWKAHKAKLRFAYIAVQQHSFLRESYRSMTNDEDVVTAAAMAGWLGRDGGNFIFPCKELANVFNLTSYRRGSDICKTLIRMGVIHEVEEAAFSIGKAARYRLASNTAPTTHQMEPMSLADDPLVVEIAKRSGGKMNLRGANNLLCRLKSNYELAVIRSVWDAYPVGQPISSVELEESCKAKSKEACNV